VVCPPLAPPRPPLLSPLPPPPLLLELPLSLDPPLIGVSDTLPILNLAGYEQLFCDIDRFQETSNPVPAPSNSAGSSRPGQVLISKRSRSGFVSSVLRRP